MVGTGVGGKNGILIKGGGALEAARHTRNIFLDITSATAEGNLPWIDPAHHPSDPRMTLHPVQLASHGLEYSAYLRTHTCEGTGIVWEEILTECGSGRFSASAREHYRRWYRSPRAALHRRVHLTPQRVFRF